MSVCKYVSMYACTHVCMYACMHVCMYACMHVCMYACMYVCMNECMYMYVCMCVCVYVCMYIHIRIIYIYIHVHIQAQLHLGLCQKYKLSPPLNTINNCFLFTHPVLGVPNVDQAVYTSSIHMFFSALGIVHVHRHTQVFDRCIDVYKYYI